MMSTVCESLDELLQSTRIFEEREQTTLLGDNGNGEQPSLEDHQAALCRDLMENLRLSTEEYEAARAKEREKQRQSVLSDVGNSPQAHNFIRTNIDYNNKNKDQPPASDGVSSTSTFNNGKNNNNIMTVRQVFDSSRENIRDLPPLLASLMTKRVETEKLLPLTQDAEANEEAMSSSASLTLTQPALVAAHLYAELLAMPGAWGSGLIEMEAVSSLSALFKRWRVECITAIEMLCVAGSNKSATNTKTKTSGKRKSSSVHSNKENNRTKRGPGRARGRRNKTISFGEDSEDSENSDVEEDEPTTTRTTAKSHSLVGQDDDDDISISNNGSIIQPSSLLNLGLRAALALSRVPMQKDFMSWSSESREAIMEALASSYGTSCALVTPATKVKLEASIVDLCESVVQQSRLSFEQCILVSGMPTDGDLDEVTHGKASTSVKRHEMAVFMFRGFFPLISMKEHLPNGELGKQLACEMVSETLQGFVQVVGKEMENANSIWTPSSLRPGNSTTKKLTRSSLSDSQHEAVTPKTASKKGRRKRVSFGGVDTQGKTPALKSGKKTPRDTPVRGYAGTKPRPVLSAALGLMQKLATLPRGLDRAHLRNSVVKSLYGCVRHLPILERSHMLRFLHQLCFSKISVHRLVGAEVLGFVLTESWLWTEHRHQPLGTPKTIEQAQVATSTPKSKTPFRRDSINSVHSVESAATLVETPVAPGPLAVDLPSALLDVLLGRLMDRAPAVRARAANSLCVLLRKVSEAVYNEDEEGPTGSSMLELRKALADIGYTLLNCLRKRAMSDEKATVRRTCVDALVELMVVGHSDDSFPFGISDEEVIALGQICQDSSMLTRRSAAQGLTTLLNTFAQSKQVDINNKSIYALVERTWTLSVFPMIMDPEVGCVTKTVDLVYTVVIEPIVLDDMDPAFNKPSYHTAWRILSLVCESTVSGTTQDVSNSLKVALTRLLAPDSRLNDVDKALLRRICDVAVVTLHGSSDQLCEPELEAQRSGVWCLFDSLVDQTTDLKALYQTLKRLKIDLDFLGTSWEKMLDLLEMPMLPLKSAQMLRACMRSCLRLLSKLASCVQSDVAQASARNLHSMLQKYTLPPDLIGSAVSALAATSIVCSGERNLDEVRRDCAQRLTSLYDTCEGTISSSAKEMMRSEYQITESVEEATVRAIFTVGELAIVGFSPDEDADPKTTNYKKKSQATVANPLRGLNVKPSSRLVDLVLTFLPRTFLASDSIPTPESARAHAFLSVGKMCLRDEHLAKKCVNILARELHSDQCPSVQSNALMVLGDLCIRYTSMVDRYLPVMAGCLQSGLGMDENIILNSCRSDKSAVVRKNAILLLSSLLLQDYVKWRGLLFHRFLVTCADNDDTVAEIGESILVGPLLTKSPKLFFNNFVESLFVLNRCMHPIYTAARSQGDAGAGAAVDFDGINLTGPAGKARRFRMYELMLSKLSAEEKLGVTARLAKDVLGSALSSDSDLHRVCTHPENKGESYESAYNVLSDCFEILSSPALKVGKNSRASDDTDDDDIVDPNTPHASTAQRVVVAKGKLLSKISSKHLIEVVFPILRRLRVILQQNKSPLSRYLSQYMVNIYKRYKDDVSNHLASEPELLQELQFDARISKKTVGGSDVDASPTAIGDDVEE